MLETVWEMFCIATGIFMAVLGYLTSCILMAYYFSERERGVIILNRWIFKKHKEKE